MPAIAGERWLSRFRVIVRLIPRGDALRIVERQVAAHPPAYVVPMTRLRRRKNLPLAATPGHVEIARESSKGTEFTHERIHP